MKLVYFFKLIFNRLLKYKILNRFLFFYIFKPNKFRKKYPEFKFEIFFKKEIKDRELAKLIIKKKNNFNTVEITFSNKILYNSLSILRAYHCIHTWIPTIIKIAKKSDQEICLNFHMSDKGQKKYLSMEQENRKNLIPDLYSLWASSEIIKNKIIKKEFIDFKNIWLKKENKIFWRGTTTGRIYKSINELKSMERIKICNLYRNKKKYRH